MRWNLFPLFVTQLNFLFCELFTYVLCLFISWGSLLSLLTKKTNKHCLEKGLLSATQWIPPLLSHFRLSIRTVSEGETGKSRKDKWCIFSAIPGKWKFTLPWFKGSFPSLNPILILILHSTRFQVSCYIYYNNTRNTSQRESLWSHGGATVSPFQVAL